MTKKIYVGNGKKRKDNWLTASVCLDDLIAYIDQAKKTPAKNGKTYINLNININDTPDQYNNDVAITINDYKPESRVPPGGLPSFDDISF
jgi:hypothetical protein